MESNFADAYKLLSGKLDHRLKRMQRRSVDWKNLRKEQQNKRRGMMMNDITPLQEVDLFDNSNTVSDSTSTVDRKNGKSTVNKKKKEDRLALFTEWKKAKEAKKREEALQKKMPFKISKIQYNDKFLSSKTTGSVPAKCSESSRKKEVISKGSSDLARKKNASSNVKRKEDNIPSSSTRVKSKVDKPTETQPKRSLRKDVKATGGSRLRASPARRTTRQTTAASRLLTATASTMAKKVDRSRGNVKGRPVTPKRTAVNKKDKKESKENVDITHQDTSKVRSDRGAPEDFTFTAPSNLKSFVFKPLSPGSASSFLVSNQDSSTVSFFIPDEETGRCSTPRSSESSEKANSESTTPTGMIATGSQPMEEEINRNEEQTMTNTEQDCDEILQKPVSSSEDESHKLDLDTEKATAGKTPKRKTRQSKKEASSGSTRSLRRSTRGKAPSVDQNEQEKEETKAVSDEGCERSTRSQKSLRRSVRSSAHNGTMDSISENVSSDDYFNCSDNVTLLVSMDKLDDSVFVKPEVMPIQNNENHSDEVPGTETENVSEQQQQCVKEDEVEKVDEDQTIRETSSEITSEICNEDNNGEKTLMGADESEFMDVDQKEETIIDSEITATESSKLMETEENTLETNVTNKEPVGEKSVDNNTVCEDKPQEINEEASQGEQNKTKLETASRESLDLATFRTPGAPPSSSKRTRRRTVASSKPAIARSPEEWVKILQNSPMVEMRRRTPKEKSPLTDDIVQPLNFDDIEDDIPHVTLMNANKETPKEKQTATEVEDNNAETAEQPQTQPPTQEVSQNQSQDDPQKEIKNDQPDQIKDDSLNQTENETSQATNNDLQMQEQTHIEEETQTRDVPYFRNLTHTEDSRLLTLGEQWTHYLQGNSHLSEEVQGCIRTVIGQAQLLRDQRFKQFTDLIDNCEFKRGEKETTCQDLSGFWDMIYFQVEDVNKKFNELSERKNANWKVEEKVNKTKKVVKKKVIKSKKPTVKSKFAEFRAHMLKEKQETKKVSPQLLKTFDAGFFKVNSPIKKSPHFHCEGGTPKKSKAVSTSKPFAEKLDCESKECEMEVDDPQEKEIEETPQTVGERTIDNDDKGEETMETVNGQQEQETNSEIEVQKTEIIPTHKQDTTCNETQPQDEIADKKKTEAENVVEKSSPVRQPLAPLSTGAGELRTPRRKSYAPVIPSPLLHDITPKPKTRRSLAVNTPKQIKSDVDICPLSATPKSKTRRKTITEAENLQQPSIEVTTPKSSKKKTTSVPKEDATPRRRSLRLRKSVCFNETPSDKPETVTETSYEAIFLPSTVDSPSENKPADITNSPFSLDSLLDKTDVQSSPRVTPKASRRKSVKRLPSDEKRRRSTRRSVHFDKSQEDHSGSGVKIRSTPYTRSSRRSMSRGDEDILFTPPQKEESTGLHDIKSRPSLLFTPPQKSEQSPTVSADNLMMFTP